jgi:hypothetical protein
VVNFDQPASSLSLHTHKSEAVPGRGDAKPLVHSDQTSQRGLRPTPMIASGLLEDSLLSVSRCRQTRANVIPNTVLPKGILEVLGMRPVVREQASGARPRSQSKPSLPSRIAVIENYLPRQWASLRDVFLGLPHDHALPGRLWVAIENSAIGPVADRTAVQEGVSVLCLARAAAPANETMQLIRIPKFLL